VKKKCKALVKYVLHFMLRRDKDSLHDILLAVTGRYSYGVDILSLISKFLVSKHKSFMLHLVKQVLMP